MAATPRPSNRRPLIYALLGAGVATAVLVAVFVLTQARERPEDIAAQVAREWTSDSIAQVASFISQRAVGDIPLVKEMAAGVISDQIRQRTVWTYSAPRRVGGDRYEVVATAAVPLEVKVLILQKKYAVSVDFKLNVDIKKKVVESWVPDLGSFKFRES